MEQAMRTTDFLFYMIIAFSIVTVVQLTAYYLFNRAGEWLFGKGWPL